MNIQTTNQKKENDCRRKTILIFPFNLLSHYLRCLVLADSYDKNEFRILFQSSASYDPYVKKHGYETFIAKQFDTNYVMQCTTNFDFSWLNEVDIEQIFLSQTSTIERFEPDLVIGDVAPTLKMAAEFKGVTYLSLLNGYLTRYYSRTRKLSVTHPAYAYLRLLPVGIRDRFTEIGERIAFKKVHLPFKKLRKAWNLKPVADYLSETEGDINYICDLPTLFPQRNLPANFSFSAPLVYKNLAHEDWIDQLSGEKPIICVSMGSSGDWRKLVFLNDPYYAKYAIVIAGQTENLFHAPHLLVKEFVNLPQLMAKASLMICHGGNGTIYLGVLAKVYLLCVTSHFEQEWNVQTLMDHHLGEFANGLTPSQWRDQIELGIKKTRNTVLFNHT
jgi:UDP:flavonoid glycosyltransferase YjiC (YdhE family)